MRDRVVSLIRTYVPVGVGAVLAYLAVEFGLDVSQDWAARLAVGVTAVVVVVYYTSVRALESRWPWLGVLLGSRQEPQYGRLPERSETLFEYDEAGQVRSARSETKWPPGPSPVAGPVRFWPTPPQE